MSQTDPLVPIDEEAQKFFILAAINPADKRPYPVQIDPATGVLINPNPGVPGDIAAIAHTLAGITEEQMGTGTYPQGFTLLTDSGNAAVMKFGPSGSPIFPLEPGESVPVTLSDLSKLYGIGSIGDEAYILGGV